MIIVLHYVLLSCLLSCTSTEHKLYLPIPLHFGNEITQVVTSASGACLKVAVCCNTSRHFLTRLLFLAI